jgi:hypothetical protein
VELGKIKLFSRGKLGKSFGFWVGREQKVDETCSEA